VAALLPLATAFATMPGFGGVWLTLALFTSIEIVLANFIEPWVYGSRTGVSPLAILVAALFWTFLWGPIGLLLSTPLTVCLVVIGRHIPQLRVLNIILGDEPALTAESQPPRPAHQRSPEHHQPH
jgi:predicted PurR-regulated permease PerM